MLLDFEKAFKRIINNIPQKATDNPGATQGSMLGPLLFVLFTVDLPFQSGCHLAAYADDIALLNIGTVPSEITSNLVKPLEEILHFCDKWKIKTDCRKSQSIYFSYKRFPQGKA